MELITKLAWGMLLLVHLSPTAVLFSPGMVQKLYRLEPSGITGLLLTHRGAQFLAVVVVCAFAAFDVEARRASSLVVAISVIGFLALYARTGLPDGPLRRIAMVDLAALAPLALVLLTAWRPQLS